MSGPWREPATETEDYPGLIVAEDYSTGSITFGSSRIALWAPMLAWTDAAEYGVTGSQRDAASAFLSDLREMRGEFARLLLILADEERRERNSVRRTLCPWWTKKRSRKRVADQLRLCLAVVES